MLSSFFLFIWAKLFFVLIQDNNEKNSKKPIKAKKVEVLKPQPLFIIVAGPRIELGTS